MKKILIFLGLMICFIQANAQFDTLRAKAVYVGDIGNQSSVVTKADIADDPVAAFDSLYANSSYAGNELSRKAKAVGLDMITMNIFFTGSSTTTQFTDGYERFVALEPVTNDTTARGFRVNITALGVSPVYNFAGVALYSTDGINLLTLIAESANDGTVFNTLGWVEVLFDEPVEIPKGVYYGNLLIDVTSGTLPTFTNISSETLPDIYQQGIIRRSHYNGGATTFSTTFTITTGNGSSQTPIMQLF